MSTSTILTGVTCLVTGGASGLGKVIATSFLKAGASVAICDIQEDRVLQMKEELAGLGALLALSVDITNPSAAQDMFTKITDTFGTLDVLVNNAGIMDRFDPVADLDPKLWDRVMSVNLTAPFMLTKLALGIMLQKQPSPTGCIINIASGAAKAGWLAGAAYTASKHGLIGLTKSTASFYGPKGIRCNALMIGVMPGTNMNDAFRDGAHPEGSQMLGSIISGHVPRPCDKEEVAALCMSLAHGPGSSIINGACINVDYGWTSVVG